MGIGLSRRHKVPGREREMTEATSGFIEACWAAWLVIWIALAFSTKRTAERGGFLGYRLVALAVFAVAYGLVRLGGVSASSVVWHEGPAIGVLADLIVLGGAAFSVWARLTLGRNWSGEITFKRDHELIQSGPYRLARHPIYTGILAMALGSAIDYGRVIGFVGFLTLCGAFWWKARAEEAIMSRHFPLEYANYRARVRAIVPFVL
jgi:protein-S-isoprenylcysteine O-methyltransferase Ste14